MADFLDLLTPENSQVLFIDQQPQMAFGVQSIDRQTLKNNVVALAKAAKMLQPGLARIESARSRLRADTAARLAKALSVPVWALQLDQGDGQ